MNRIILKGKDAAREYRKIDDQVKINQCIHHINRLEFLRNYFFFLMNAEKISASEDIKEKLASLG